MPINFPSAPAVGDTYPYAGKIWQWNGTGWKLASGKPVLMTWAATITLDCSLGNTFDVTLAGATTVNLSNAVDGQRILLRARQDATGSRVWTPGSMIRFSADLTSFTLSTTASKLDRIGFEYCAADAKYDVISYNRGY